MTARVRARRAPVLTPLGTATSKAILFQATVWPAKAGPDNATQATATQLETCRRFLLLHIRHLPLEMVVWTRNSEADFRKHAASVSANAIRPAVLSCFRGVIIAFLPPHRPFTGPRNL